MFIFLVFCISIQQTILHSYNTLAKIKQKKKLQNPRKKEAAVTNAIIDDITLDVKETKNRKR